ncbi:hypothetical protein [Alcanivorax sp. 1008]|uniref:hypothetical protein n=1 Tax=Alcanivorax sp. 1008 TaxID=2816853 RepID=UPI001D8F8000|nr:hypothetical protein [Alcanivorax sp. 1008]MCC1496778.1 hypothetical protein [Alcanivorax sp. 1008]
MKRLGSAVIRHKDLVEFYRLEGRGVTDVEDAPIKVARMPVSGTKDDVDIAMYSDELTDSPLLQPVYDVGVWRNGNTIAATGALAGLPPLMDTMALKGEHGQPDALLRIEVDSLAGLDGEDADIAFLPLDNEDAYRWAQRTHVCPESTSMKLAGMALYAFDISRLTNDQVNELRVRAGRILAEIAKKSRVHDDDNDCEDDAPPVFAP